MNSVYVIPISSATVLDIGAIMIYIIFIVFMAWLSTVIEDPSQKRLKRIECKIDQSDAQQTAKLEKILQIVKQLKKHD